MADDLDFDDDLFEFDELAESSAPEEFEPAVERAESTGARNQAFQPLNLIDDASDELGQGTQEEDDLHDEPHVVVASARMPPIVVPLLLVMAAANLALVGLTWKSMRSPSQLTLPVLQPTSGLQPNLVQAETGASELDRERPELGRAEPLRDVPGFPSSRDEAWAVLEEAQRAIEADEFVSGRRTLYGMLTVIDRVEPAERPDLESRAGFLIAESYRLQATARAPSQTKHALARGAAQ